MSDQSNHTLAGSSGDAVVPVVEHGLPPAKRMTWKRWALAFGVAAVSDMVSFWTEFVPPVQWVIDLATAGLLFLILGKRWAILPGLITEAIPGMGIFPVWVLVVASIAVYDDIHNPHRKLQRAIEKLSR
ncbi:MAG: hypothetical protein WBE97_04510 [Candidatus Acidiferrales bacterium]